MSKNMSTKPLKVIITDPESNQNSPHYEFLQHSGQVRDFRHSRRAFLSSYRFSERSGFTFTQKLRNSVKELNGAACDVYRQVSRRRRVGAKVFRFPMALPSFLHVSIRCLTPWMNKKEFMV